MKITKLKRGWRINLTDTEMEVLRWQVFEGSRAVEEDLWDSLSPAEKRIMTEISYMKRKWVGL